MTISPARSRLRPGRYVVALALVCSLALSGCSYFRQKAAERYVYVTARQVFLRDRVAAVSNRTGTAVNGEKLVVLERTRRAIKVRTPRGEVGWVEEKLTADQKTADQFAALRAAHEGDPIVATATARDEVYLHDAPGRETERFYRLAEGDTVSLLARATVPKVPPVAPSTKPKPAAPPELPAAEAPHERSDKKTAAEDSDMPVPPPVMEDWWLVRIAKGQAGGQMVGQTGWILSRMIDVSVPDVLERYAEGQRIVGAYVLNTVTDPDSGMLDNGQPVTRIPEYVALLSPYKAGLPYDFDQVRVYTWNVKKHRYETAFHEQHVVGYLPAVIGSMKDRYGTNAVAQLTLPSFTYRVLAAGEPIPTPDPVTGLVHPQHLIEKTYRLEGNICRRILPPGTSAPAEAHPVPDNPHDKNGKSKKKHKP